MSAPLTYLTDDELALAAPRRLPLRQISPIRCPGGKAGQQVLDLSKFVPASFGDLYEPFMGGMNMSLLLLKERRVAPSRCHASDSCLELVRFFEGLQVDGERLAQALLADERVHGRGSHELFAEALNLIKLAEAALQAAQGFYLHNRLSYLAIRDFASLSRYAPTGVAESGLTRRLIHQLLPFAQLLQGVRIARRGYRSSLGQAAASKGAFVFLDPPYESVDQKKSYKGHAKAIYNTTFDFDLFARCVHAAMAH